MIDLLATQGAFFCCCRHHLWCQHGFPHDNTGEKVWMPLFSQWWGFWFVLKRCLLLFDIDNALFLCSFKPHGDYLQNESHPCLLLLFTEIWGRKKVSRLVLKHTMKAIHSSLKVLSIFYRICFYALTINCLSEWAFKHYYCTVFIVEIWVSCSDAASHREMILTKHTNRLLSLT